jgi:hypothetical protein
MPESKDISIKRIMVAVSNLHDLTPFDTAAALAKQLQAQLDALFVEDINLFHLAELPFAKELDQVSGKLRPVSLSHMEQALQTQARRIHKTLTTISQDKQVEWNMSVVRGNYFKEAMSASNIDVLFILGPKQTSASQTIAKILTRNEHTVTRRFKPVYVYFDNSQSSSRALELANKLANLINTSLIILLPEITETLINSASNIITTNHHTHFETTNNNMNSIRSIIKHTGCSLFVTSRKIIENETSHEQQSAIGDYPLVLVS